MSYFIHPGTPPLYISHWYLLMGCSLVATADEDYTNKSFNMVLF